MSRAAYFVRVAEDRQVVGIFVAASLTNLRDLVDQCCDPEACEYAACPEGGFYVPDRTAATWPAPDDAEGTGLEGGCATDTWLGRLGEAGPSLRWKPLDGGVSAGP